MCTHACTVWLAHAVTSYQRAASMSGTAHSKGGAQVGDMQCKFNASMTHLMKVLTCMQLCRS